MNLMSYQYAFPLLRRLRYLSVLAVFAIVQLLAGCGSATDGVENTTAQSQLKMDQSTDWSVVTTSTAGDGYVLYADATYQWLDANCVTTLKEQGLAVSAIQWSQLSEQSQLDGMANCETVRTALSDRLGDNENVFPDTPWRIVTTGGTDGYVLYQSGNRHWLNAACIARIKATQIPVLELNWSEINEMPQLAGEGDCDAIEQTLGEQGNTTPVWRIVTTNDAGDGYVLYPGNVRRWLSESCIDRLKRNGIAVTQVQWSQISDYHQETFGKCSDLLGRSQIERNEAGWAVVTTPNNGDGYLLTPNGDRLWLSAQCVQSLRDDQLPISVAQWEDISDMRQIGLGDCNTARAALGGEDRPSEFDLFMMDQLDLTFAQWRHYLRLQQELSERQVFGQFERQLGDAFAGAYLERGADGFHNYVVAVKGDQALEPVNGYLPDIVKRVKYSLKDLEALRIRIQSIVPFGEDMDVWSISTDVFRNAISLGTGIGASGPVRRLLDQYSFPQDAVVIDESAGRPRFN